MRFARLILPIFLLSSLSVLGGCSHVYRKAYRFEAPSPELPTAQLIARFEMGSRSPTRLRSALRFVTAEFFEHGTECPTSSQAMVRKVSGGRYLGTIDLKEAEKSNALTIPAGGFLAVTNFYDDRGFIVHTSCRSTFGFVPLANESYELLFRIGSGECVVDLRDAGENRVPIVSHEECEELLRSTTASEREERAPFDSGEP